VSKIGKATGAPRKDSGNRVNGFQQNHVGTPVGRKNCLTGEGRLNLEQLNCAWVGGKQNLGKKAGYFRQNGGSNANFGGKVMTGKVGGGGKLHQGNRNFERPHEFGGPGTRYSGGLTVG